MDVEYGYDMEGLKRVAKLIRKILKSDRDAVVGVSGLEGEGKSTLIIWLMMLMDKNFSLEKNIIFMPTEEEIRNKIFSLKKGSPVSLDEAMKVLYKRGWMTKQRRNLNILFSICRKRNLAFFMAIPNFWDLDQYYRNHRIKIWLFVPTRGEALLFIRDHNPFVDDPWWKKKNQKIVEKFLKRGGVTDKGVMINALKKTKNYKYSFSFPDLPQHIKDKYLRLNMEQFQDLEYDNIEEKMSATQKKYLLKIENAAVMLSKKGWMRKDIAKLFDYTPDSMGRILKKYKARGIDLINKAKELTNTNIELQKSSKSAIQQDSGNNDDIIKELFGTGSNR